MCDYLERERGSILQYQDVSTDKTETTLVFIMSEGEGKAPPATEGNKAEATAPPVGTNAVTATTVATGNTSMSPPVSTLLPPTTTAMEDEDESEDESEILEESPCGRWQKRREEVSDRERERWLLFYIYVLAFPLGTLC